MNSIQVREQMVNFLLQQHDANVRVIEELNRKVAELQKQLGESAPKDTESKPKKNHRVEELKPKE